MLFQTRETLVHLQDTNGNTTVMLQKGHKEIVLLT